jgi:Mn-dependent DtxR family transcriptional regulator
MARPIDSEAMCALESLIDTCGSANVLDVIATIACGKADHIEQTWQDNTLARIWTQAGHAINRTASNQYVQHLSR